MWERYRSSHLTLKRRKTSKRLTKSWSFALMAPSNEKKRNSSLIKSQTFTLWSKHLKIQCFGVFLSSLLLPVAVFWIPRVAFWIAQPCSFQIVRQLVEHFPCLSISVSQAPVDRGTIILCFAQCSALPNFAPPFASDRALSVLTAPQSHWDLSAPSFHPACTPKTHTHTYTQSHTHTHTHTHTHRRTHSPRLYCLSLERTRAGNERRNKSCQSKERNREVRISVGMLRTMRYFVPGFIIGLCLIWNRQLITLETTSPQHSSTAVSWKQSPHWNCLVGFLVQLLNSVQIVLDATE